MELLGTSNSPYTRIVRVLAAELGLPVTLRELSWRTTPQQSFEASPVGRVPVLIDGDLHLYDSRVIAEYLLQHPEARRPGHFRAAQGSDHWHAQNVVTLAYSIMDGGGILRTFGDLPGSHPYLERSRQRIRQCFDEIDRIVGAGFLADGRFGVVDIAVITAYQVACAAGFLPEAAPTHLPAWAEQHRDRPSIANTMPHFARP